jgi:hypothetical protein
MEGNYGIQQNLVIRFTLKQDAQVGEAAAKRDGSAEDADL